MDSGFCVFARCIRFGDIQVEQAPLEKELRPVVKERLGAFKGARRHIRAARRLLEHAKPQVGISGLWAKRHGRLKLLDSTGKVSLGCGLLS